MTIQSQIKAFVEEYNQYHPQGGYPVAMIMAFCEIESNFDEEAYREESRIHDASYGLMQLLYGTAKWLGYSGTADGLYDIKTNIQLGMAYLDKNWLILQRGKNESPSVKDLVESYNCGAGNVLRNFDDGVYYNRWLEAYNKWSEVYPT